MNGAARPSWTLLLDRAACLGSGVCAAVAPDHFALGEDSVGVARHPQVEADDRLLDARDCCPAEAIRVEDARGESVGT